jgi:hypothetical protein
VADFIFVGLIMRAMRRRKQMLFHPATRKRQTAQTNRTTFHGKIVKWPVAWLVRTIRLVVSGAHDPVADCWAWCVRKRVEEINGDLHGSVPQSSSQIILDPGTFCGRFRNLFHLRLPFSYSLLFFL